MVLAGPSCHYLSYRLVTHFCLEMIMIKFHLALSSINHSGQTRHLNAKEWNWTLTLYHTLNSKLIKDLNKCKIWNYKITRRKHTGEFIQIYLRNDLLCATPKHRQQKEKIEKVGLSLVTLVSRAWLFVTPWTAACQSSLSVTNSQSSLKLMYIESVMPSNHLILCHPLFLLPSIFPSILVISNRLVLPIRWPKYQSFSFSISPSNEYSGLISFRMDWLDFLAV